MDRCVLLTSTPSCAVSPRGDHEGAALNEIQQATANDDDIINQSKVKSNHAQIS